jgi:hypothetical protein
MKFGKTLLNQQIPEYAAKYITPSNHADYALVTSITRL